MTKEKSAKTYFLILPAQVRLSLQFTCLCILPLVLYFLEKKTPNLIILCLPYPLRF